MHCAKLGAFNFKIENYFNNLNKLMCNHKAKYYAYYYNYFSFQINWFVSSESAFHYILIGFTEL